MSKWVNDSHFFCQICKKTALLEKIKAPPPLNHINLNTNDTFLSICLFILSLIQIFSGLELCYLMYIVFHKSDLRLCKRVCDLGKPRLKQVLRCAGSWLVTPLWGPVEIFVPGGGLVIHHAAYRHFPKDPGAITTHLCVCVCVCVCVACLSVISESEPQWYYCCLTVRHY